MPSERWSGGAISHWRTRKPIRKLFFQTIAHTQFTHCFKFLWSSHFVPHHNCRLNSTSLLSNAVCWWSSFDECVPKIAEITMPYRSFETRRSLKNVREKKSVMCKSHFSFFLRPLVDLSSCRDGSFRCQMPSPWLIIDPDHRRDSATHAAVLALYASFSISDVFV